MRPGREKSHTGFCSSLKKSKTGGRPVFMRRILPGGSTPMLAAIETSRLLISCNTQQTEP